MNEQNQPDPNILFVSLNDQYKIVNRDMFYIPDNESWQNDIMDIHKNLAFNNMNKLKKLAQKCNINNFSKLRKFDLIDQLNQKIVFEQ